MKDSDIPQLPRGYSARQLRAEAVARARLYPNEPLWRRFIALCPRDMIVGLGGAFLHATTCTVLRPLILKMLIDAAAREEYTEVSTTLRVEPN